MKTALTEVKEKIEMIISMFNDCDNMKLSERGMLDAYINCLNWVNESLEKERLDLMNSFDKGFKDRRIGFEYFNETFKQNENNCI